MSIRNRISHKGVQVLRAALLTSFLIALATLLTTQGRLLGRWTAAVGAQGQDPCAAQTLPLNTSNNLTVGAADTNWTVLSDPDPTTVEPRPAWVIGGAWPWQPALPDSDWISSYPTTNNSKNGAYDFETCFCLRRGFTNAALNLSLRADDQADVYLNGTAAANLLGSTPGGSYSLPATTINYSGPLLVTGRNCLRVRVNNTGQGLMGLNLTGTISANGVSGAGLQTAACCNPTGNITGAKWHDVNGNGIWDTGELGLPGWQITLSNGATATTDSAGYYSFNSLPPGNYTVTETQQSCWQQTFPTGTGTHVINVAANQAYVANFGNRKTGKADFTATTVCLGQPTQFTNLSACATSWNWSFGSSALNPTYTFTSAGTHAVTLCINGGASCVTKNVIVKPKPAAPVITGPPSTCAGLTATYSVPLIGGLAHSWSVTPGSTINSGQGTNAVNVTWSPGGGMLTLTVSNNAGCSTTTTFTVAPCPVDQCCAGRIGDNLSPANFVDQGGGIYAVKPVLTFSGPAVKKVTVDIISATLTPGVCGGSGGPLNAYITSAAPGAGFVSLVPVLYSHAAIWTAATPVNMTTIGVTFPMTVQFPAPPGYQCSDTLSFCLRYTITDVNCRTCEVIRCYSFSRIGGPIINAAPRTEDDPDTHASTERLINPTRSVAAARASQLSKSRGAQPSDLRGPIWAKWFSLGGAESFLGQPVTGELPIPNFSGEGNLARFQGGSIYFTPETGAVAIPDLAGSLISARDYTQLKRAAEDQLADPFVRLKSGRMAYVVAVGDGEYRLGDSATEREALILFDSRRGPGEYFIVENRFRPDEPDNLASGVAVWHVVEDLGLFKRVELQAEALGEFGEHGLRLLRHVSGRQTALLQAGEVLTSESLPPLRWLDGSPANFEIRLLSAPGANVRLAVTIRR